MNEPQQSRKEDRWECNPNFYFQGTEETLLMRAILFLTVILAITPAFSARAEEAARGNFATVRTTQVDANRDDDDMTCPAGMYYVGYGLCCPDGYYFCGNFTCCLAYDRDARGQACK